MINTKYYRLISSDSYTVNEAFLTICILTGTKIF